MHLIFLLICIPLLVAVVFQVAVMLPFGLIFEGMAAGQPGPVVAGVLFLLVIWGGIFALLAR